MWCPCVQDEEDVYGEEARGEDDADDDDDEGQEAEVEATLRANVLLVPHFLCLLTNVSFYFVIIISGFIVRLLQLDHRCITTVKRTRATTTPQPFYGPFSGTTQVSQRQKRTSGLCGARED